nr:T9SS type A sorting domain-containing protein [uncultured Psychroserpens sp.]
MRKKYTIYCLIIMIYFGFTVQNTNAQLRITEVDPATERIQIKNFGATAIDISSYRLCSKFKYGTLSNMTVTNGLLNLMPNATVDVTVALSGGTAIDDAADMGLYLPTGNFGSAANMIDFTQWGSGGNGRESQAVQNGFWTAGTFINVSAPYEFIGGANDTGVAFWDTLLGANGFDNINKFNISPNPAYTNLNITIPNNIENATVRVFDILGKKVLEKEVGSLQTFTINVGKWNTGVYIVRVSSEDVTQTKRFIKQ